MTVSIIRLTEFQGCCAEHMSAASLAACEAGIQTIDTEPRILGLARLSFFILLIRLYVRSLADLNLQHPEL